MKWVGVVLSLLLVGLSSGIGEGPKCYKCHARNAETCKGEEIQCPKGSYCMFISEHFECNHTYHSVEARCSNNLKCNISMYAKANNLAAYEISRQCCEGDLCNNGTYSMPNKGMENDGPECPYCAQFDTLEKCKPVGTTVCANANDQCAYLVGWVTKPDSIKTKFSVQGCMSETSCKYDYSQTIGYGLDEVKAQDCWLPQPDNQTNAEESKQ